MPYSFREKLGLYLQQFKFLHPLILKYDGVGPNGHTRYVNRISNFTVMKEKK